MQLFIKFPSDGNNKKKENHQMHHDLLETIFHGDANF